MSNLNENDKTATGGAGAGGGEKAKSILKSSEKLAGHFPPFRVDLRYRNTLPDIPFDPYFLEIPFPSDFLWGFRQSTLEKNYKYRIHMNPPALSDDMIDPLGAEEWAKAVVYDERDKALQRKEGAEERAFKNVRANREAKTWMVKTIYTRENVHRPSQSPSPDLENLGEETFNATVIDEDRDSRVRSIKQQFEVSNSGEMPKAPPGKKIKRVLPFLPLRLLRELELHLVRYKAGERVMRENDGRENDDTRVVRKALLVRRKDDEESETQANPFTPLSLFLPKLESSGSRSDDDEDELEDTSEKAKEEEKEDDELFGDDDDEDEELFGSEGDDEEEKKSKSSSNKKKKVETKSTSADTAQKAAELEDLDDPKAVEYIREYQAQLITAKKTHDRLALVFEENAVRYVELAHESLRLFRIKQPGDKERVREESDVEVIIKRDPAQASDAGEDDAVLTKEELRARKRRREMIEGKDFEL